VTDSTHREHLRRGFNWLGGATIAAKVIDFSTILIVLLFLTKAEVGTASIVISIAMVVEAFDGLGTAEALIQAKSVSRLQLDTLFWFVTSAAAIVGGLTLLAAPWIAELYGEPGMAAYFIAAAVKQPLVGAALIPLAIMNRDLQYERIAMVGVFATLAAALTRIVLAVSGAGTWALVVGFAASGFYTLIGTAVARPFRPGLRFKLAEITPLIRFGLRAASANIFEQTFKNIDFLLIGWFWGAAPLAVYRVAFDVAMEPAMAVGTLVNRTALPVFARVAAVKDQLAQSLAWSVGRLTALVAPLAAGLFLAAGPLTALLHDEQGNSYAAAALPLKLLAAAAFLRVILQLLTPLMLASGRPGSAAGLSAAALLMLTAGIAAAGIVFDPATGIVAVSAVWLAVYPVLMVWGGFYLKRSWGIAVWELAPGLIAPLGVVVAMLAGVTLIDRLAGNVPPAFGLAIAIAATALAYAGLFITGRRSSEQPRAVS
jgi:O-antigen/teichoic acid export membrane protein